MSKSGLIIFVCIICTGMLTTVVNCCRMRRIIKQYNCADGNVEQKSNFGVINYKGDGLAPNGTTLHNCIWQISEVEDSDNFAIAFAMGEINLPVRDGLCTGSLKFPGENEYTCDVSDLSICRLYTTKNTTCQANLMESFVKKKFKRCTKFKRYLLPSIKNSIYLKLQTTEDKEFTINFESINCTNLATTSVITESTPLQTKTTFTTIQPGTTQSGNKTQTHKEPDSNTGILLAIILPILLVLMVGFVLVFIIRNKMKKVRKSVSTEDHHQSGEQAKADQSKDTSLYVNDNYNVDEAGYEVPRNMLQYENLQTEVQYENFKDDTQYENLKDDQPAQTNSNIYTDITNIS